MMGAFEFIIEHKRMCNSHRNCNGCPLINDVCLAADWGDVSSDKLPTVIHAIELWSKANPIATNEMKFREVFGDNAVNSLLALYPSDIRKWLAEPYEERES